MKNICYYICFFFLVSSCEKSTNPFVPKTEIDELIASQNPEIEYVCFIYNNDIYYLENFKEPARRITNSPNRIKSKLKINNNHTKIAYFTSNHIEVIDLNGNIIDRITEFTEVKSFDWSQDDQTLYILNGNSFAFHGASLDVPNITFPQSIPGNVEREIIDASISALGDVVYIVKHWNPLNGYRYLMVTKPNDGSNTELIYTNSYKQMDYIRFSKNQQDLALGYDGPGQTTLELFKNLEQMPDLVLSSSEELRNVIFRSDINSLVLTYKSSSGNNFVLMSRNLMDFPSKDVQLEEFNSEDSKLYIDWK